MSSNFNDWANDFLAAKPKPLIFGGPHVELVFSETTQDALRKLGLNPVPDGKLRSQGRCQRAKEKMARARYQKGSLLLREGKRRKVWIGRWLERVIENGIPRLVYRSEILGTTEEYRTKKKARARLDEILREINANSYKPRPTALFAEFASRWEKAVVVNFKPSTQATVKSHVRKYLVPAFGKTMLRDFEPELVQRFLSGLKVSAKTVRNISVTLQGMFKSARAWGYISTNPLDGVVLPRRIRSSAHFFTLDEVQHIIGAAEEPYKTFYWLAAETGMRAGELCGLRTSDLDLSSGQVSVRQSAWRGKIQSPKTENAYRTIPLSLELCEHLAGFLRTWRPNERHLMFANRNGNPWDANLLVKRKMRPLLKSLGIEGGGLHSLRHANETMMDRLNVPMKVRQERLGHSDPRITLGTYTHTVSEDHKRVADELGKAISPNFHPTSEAASLVSETEGYVN